MPAGGNGLPRGGLFWSFATKSGEKEKCDDDDAISGPGGLIALLFVVVIVRICKSDLVFRSRDVIIISPLLHPHPSLARSRERGRNGIRR